MPSASRSDKHLTALSPIRLRQEELQREIDSIRRYAHAV
jgi:hypothetical protein